MSLEKTLKSNNYFWMEEKGVGGIFGYGSMFRKWAVKTKILWCGRNYADFRNEGLQVAGFEFISWKRELKIKEAFSKVTKIERKNSFVTEVN